LTDGCADASASKCNGLVREKELEPWVGDGATNEDGLEAIEDSVVDGFDRNEVMCRPRLIVIFIYKAIENSAVSLMAANQIVARLYVNMVAEDHENGPGPMLFATF